MDEQANRPLHHEVLVSKQSLASADAYDVILSNVRFVGALKDEYFEDREQAPDAMRSYWVDYYLGQVNNGGFSQFVYNTRWEPECVAFVKQGLEAIGACRHLALFGKAGAAIEALGQRRLKRFFGSEYFGDNEERDFLSGTDDEFVACDEQESLIELNARWLKSLPNLRAVERELLASEVTRLAALIGDREQRKARALEAEPRYMKLIRALTQKAGYELKGVTAGSPIPRERRVLGLFPRRYHVIAWHFHTDRGLHYMVEDQGAAEMYEKKTGQLVTQIVARDAYGPG